MFRCRELSQRETVLSVDYSVDCKTTLHRNYQVAALVCIAVAVAIPAVVLWRVRRLSDGGGKRADDGISYRVAAELDVGVEGAREAIAKLDTVRTFSFMTSGMASKCLWWEPVDMMRKLSIVCAGTLIGKGDATMKLFVVQLLACCWLIVQVRVRPYRLAEVRL